MRPSSGPYERSADVLWRRLDDEVVLVGARGGDICVLNRVGADVWDCLERPCGLQEITATLAERYSVSAAVVRGDVERFLEVLLGCGAVTPHENTRGTELCAFG